MGLLTIANGHSRGDDACVSIGHPQLRSLQVNPDPGVHHDALIQHSIENADQVFRDRNM
jgi:hypothetical protein